VIVFKNDFFYSSLGLFNVWRRN